MRPLGGMFSDARFLFEQGQGLRALGRLLVAPKGQLETLPGPTHSLEVAAPSRALVGRFVRFCGGEPSSYRQSVPPHLFSQWCLPAMLQATRSLPYPKARVINAGCRLQVYAPIPAGEDLAVSARVKSIDDNSQRALIQLELCTGPVSEPKALVAELHLYVRLDRQPAAGPSKPKQKPVVPTASTELRTFCFDAAAGRRFACLTGDINPIHWLSPYARAAGFRSCILHGFGSFAATFEGLVRTRLSGDPSRLTSLDANFSRPLLLPANVGLYQAGDRQIFLGDAAGGAAYLEAEFSFS